MAQAKAKKEKKLKKRWIPILAPEVFNRAVVGESVSDNPETLKGRTVVVNLTNLTHDVKQQNINLRLRVVKLEDNQAITEIVGYQFTPVAIRRMTHRHADVIDDSQLYQTKDTIIVRLKPFIMTRHNITNSVKQTLRKSAQQFFVKQVASLTYNELMRDIITNKFQSGAEKHLNRIYPLKFCVVREIVLHEGTAKPTIVTEAKIEKPKEEKPAETPVIEKAEHAEQKPAESEAGDRPIEERI